MEDLIIKILDEPYKRFESVSEYKACPVQLLKIDHTSTN
jgi:hypothetical protein